MRKFMKVLGFLSVLATFSDVSGMAAFRLTPGRDESMNEVVSDDVISEDFLPFSPKKPRRSRQPRVKVKEKKAENSAKDSPQPSLSSNTTLFTDIVANREFFVQFDFGGHERDTLCAVNGEMGKDTVGLLLMEPAGILNSLLIDRNTLAVIHKKASIPNKELRSELAESGVLIPDARLIASQVAEVRKNSPATPEKRPEKREKKTPVRPPKIWKNEALWTKVRERVSKEPKLSPAESREILERFRKELQESGNIPKQKEVTEK
jgi:hypothetical protein